MKTEVIEIERTAKEIIFRTKEGYEIILPINMLTSMQNASPGVKVTFKSCTTCKKLPQTPESNIE